MNTTLKAEIYTLQKSFTDLPKIEIIKDIEAGDDCDWIQIRFDDACKGHLFMSHPYPCKYVVVYPPDRLHFNPKTKDLEAIFFTSDSVTSVVKEMIHEYENPPKPISLGSNFSFAISTFLHVWDDLQTPERRFVPPELHVN